jgi:hypothetical protein
LVLVPVYPATMSSEAMPMPSRELAGGFGIYRLNEHVQSMGLAAPRAG